MDLQLPDMSGIEAMIAIRQEFPEARIIVLTTYAGDVQVVRALKGFPEVENIYTTNGRWDLVAELCTSTLAGFSQALDQIRLIEGIAATETSLLLASAK